MKTLHFFICVLSLFSITTFPQTTISPGDVSGTWLKSGNPYLITGDITVQNNNTLTIQPGVIIRFQGNYELNVFGRLLAIGAPNDTIYFTAQDTAVGWHGIRFFNSNSNSMDSSKLVLCKFTGGKALTTTTAEKRGGAVYCEQSSDVLIKSCVFMNNYAAYDGGAVALINNSAAIIDSCVFMYNDCGFYGGGVYIDGSNSIIRNSVFSNNNASFFGAAIAGWNSSAFRVENCKVINNTSGAATGIYTAVNCSPYIVNTLFSGNSNSLGFGGACGFSVSTPTLVNVTIADNSATQGGGGMWIYNSTATIKNAVVYNNFPDQLNVTGSTVSVTYSNIMGGYTGTGNINVNPLFAGTGLNFYSLQDSSPCRNAGTPDTTSLNLPLLDLAGNPRISDNIIDMGAYEIQGIIPVELLSFNANVAGSSVLLTWSTATELNNMGFEIEKSESINKNPVWKKIGYVQGFGTSLEEHSYSFNDENTEPGKYNYRLKQMDFDGSYCYHLLGREIEIFSIFNYSLQQNYPNPFNPSTTIDYGIKEKSNVKITVVNAIGEEIAVLVNEEKESGYHTVEFNAATLPSGVYFYQLKSGDYVSTKKMILLR